VPAKRIVYLNGKFIAADNKTALVRDPAFLAGPGVFETMRSYRGRIVYLDEHLRRLKRSSALAGLKLNYTAAKLKAVIGKAVSLNKLRDACVRVTVWRSAHGMGILAAAEKYEPHTDQKYKAGFSAYISSVRQNDPSSALIKSVNRILYDMALKEARIKGCDEAVLVNSKGELAEGSRSNIFLVKDGQVFTPLLECGCLDGITRRAVLALAKKKKIKVHEARLLPRDLLSADEAFLTNSLMGIMPLTFLERTAIGKRGSPVTALLVKEYNILSRK